MDTDKDTKAPTAEQEEEEAESPVDFVFAPRYLRSMLTTGYTNLACVAQRAGLAPQQVKETLKELRLIEQELAAAPNLQFSNTDAPAPSVEHLSPPSNHGS
jgi:hypothetical protein